MAYNVNHFEISNKLSRKFLVQKHTKWLLPGDRYMNHVRERGVGGGANVFLCVCAEETGRVKICLGESA